MTESAKLTRHEFKVTMIAILIAVVTSFGIDMHLPALPAMMKAFNTSRGMMQNSISVYLLGLVIMSFFYGPYSDKVGRKPVLIFGMIVAVIGSLVCTLAHSIDVFLLGRLIQGIGAAAGLSITRSLLPDVLTREKLAAYGSFLSIFVTVGTMVSPVIGGYLQTYIDWQSVFAVLTICFVVALLTIIFALPETNKSKNPHAFHPLHLIKNYWTILRNPTFMGYTLTSSLAYCAVIAYVTVSPFLFQIQYHLSPIVYGWLGVIIGVIGIFGKTISGIQVSITKNIHTGIWTGIGGYILVGVISFALSMLHLNTAITMIVWACLIMFLLGFIGANSLGGAMSEFRGMSGASSAMLGGLQNGFAVLTTAVIATLPSHGDKVLTSSYLVLSLGAALSFFFGCYVLVKR